MVAVPGLVLAQEPAKFNLATAQIDSSVSVSPGGQKAGRIALYNIDGNRTTHIILGVTQAPEGWQVDFEPSVTEVQVEEDGSTFTVTQNLQVEPSAPLTQPEADVPDGMICINIGKRGYVVANLANVIVRAPKSAEVGAREKIVVSATAQWLGQTGAGTMSQNRDFEFSVEVVPGGSTGSNMWKWILGSVSGAAVIVAAVLLVVRSRRKHA